MGLTARIHGARVGTWFTWVAFMHGTFAFSFLTLLSMALLSGCSEKDLERPTLRLATTTSTRDSGLLDRLLPVFESAHACRVDVIAVGTGAALRLGESGDADILIVHAPAAERAFVEGDEGIDRRVFMSNHFRILGPEQDPAKIRGMLPMEALARLASTNARFVSRGDDSGTHKREVLLRDGRDVRAWPALIESGQGMGATLRMADELRAYLLCDAGSYLAQADSINLVSLVPEHSMLENPYSVIRLRSSRRPALSDAFADFLTGSEAQKLIESFRIDGAIAFKPLTMAHRDD